MKKVILLICQTVVSICCMTAQTISQPNAPDDIVNCLMEAGNDTLLVLNECESKFLNYRLQTQRDTFDFTGKRVAFFRGNTGKIRTSKIFFFDRIKESYNINGYVGNTSINSNRLFVLEEKDAKQVGCDAVIFIWCKKGPFSRKEILKRLRK